jgi:hypothetical protein
MNYLQSCHDHNCSGYNYGSTDEGHETSSLILQEEQRLGVFENRMPSNLLEFGTKRVEAAGEWRTL